jgi:MFS family permease
VNIIVVVATFLFVISKYIKSYETVILARFVSGIVIGLLSGVVPIYLNEISPINLRGSIGTIQQVISVFGKLSANIAGLSQLLGTEKLWPILTGLLILPSFIHIGLFFLVDSPKYLFTHESKDAAHLGFIFSFIYS